MYTHEDLVKMLSEGKSIDSIAQEFTDALNSASAEVQKQKELEAKKNDKVADLASILNLMFGFIAEHYPELKVDDTDVDYMDLASELVDEIDELIPLVVSLSKMAEARSADPFIKFFGPMAPVKVKIKKSDDDVLRNFLDKFVK